MTTNSTRVGLSRGFFSRFWWLTCGRAVRRFRSSLSDRLRSLQARIAPPVDPTVTSIVSRIRELEDAMLAFDEVIRMEQAERKLLWEKIELVLAQEAHSQERFRPLEQALASKRLPDDMLREAHTYTNLEVSQLRQHLMVWATETFMKKPQKRTKESHA